MKHPLILLFILTPLFVLCQIDCIDFKINELIGKSHIDINNKLINKEWSQNNLKIRNFKKNIDLNIELKYTSYSKEGNFIINFETNYTLPIILIKTNKNCFEKLKTEIANNNYTQKIQNKSNNIFFEEYYRITKNKESFILVFKSNNSAHELLFYKEKVWKNLNSEILEKERQFNLKLSNGDKLEKEKTLYDLSKNLIYQELINEYPRKAYLIKDKIHDFNEIKASKIKDDAILYENKNMLLKAKETYDFLKVFLESNKEYNSEFVNNIKDTREKIIEIDRKIDSDKKLNLEKKILNAMSIEKFSKAEELCNQLKVIDPLNKTVENTMVQINKMKVFLFERENKTYNYFQTDEFTERDAIKMKILAPSLASIKNDNQYGRLKYDLHIGFNNDGKNLSTIEYFSKDDNFNIISNDDLSFISPSKVNGYFVTSKSTLDIDIIWSNMKFKVTNTALSKNQNQIIYGKQINSNEKNKVEKFIENQENSFGKYSFNLKKTTVNNETVYNIEPIKFKCKTGPKNAIYSLLCPGLGQYRVTNKQKGIYKIKGFLVIASTTILSKLYSDYSYNKYLNSNDQSEMDRHYESANISNKIFLSGVLVSTCFYFEDIIYTLKKGKSNKKNEKIINSRMINYQF